MAKPVTTFKTLTGAILHLVIILASEAGVTGTPTDYKAATVNTWLEDGIYFPQVATGNGFTAADGNTWENMLGQTNLLDIINTGVFQIAGFTKSSENDILEYLGNKDCHIALIAAPADRKDSDQLGGTFLEGDELVIYSNQLVRIKPAPNVQGAPSGLMLDVTSRIAAGELIASANETILADA